MSMSDIVFLYNCAFKAKRNQVGVSNHWIGIWTGMEWNDTE